jgi:hypothetical protein
MNQNRTASILQRLPVILAVTAASYGLAQPPAPRILGNGQPAQQTQAQLPRR